MDSFIKFLCLSILLANIHLGLGADKPLHLKADYFIYSDDLHYMYGGGNISLKKDSFIIRGDNLYLDLQTFIGVIYGHVFISDNGRIKKADVLVCKGFPFSYRCDAFGQQIITRGDQGLPDSITKRSPQELKKSDLYWEFFECEINKNKKIKAKMVFPFIMGIPSIPFKSFSITRGKIPEKTRLYFKNIGFSSLDGLSLSLLYRMRESFVSGDYNIKFYERELFNENAEIKRGILLSGQMDWLVKKKKFINLSALYNTGDESFNFTLSHRKDLKNISYSISQNISGRENVDTAVEFNSWLMVKKFKFMSPKISFVHNLKNSYSYGLSTPFKVWKKLNFNINYLRKVINEEVESDTQDFSAAMDFTSSLLTLSSVFNISENMLAATQTRNFSTNLKFKTLFLLEKNVSINLSPFYMFSTIPSEDTENSHIFPGVNVEIKSAGLILPLDFIIVPSLTINHVWDNLDVDQTEFNYFLSLKKVFWKLSCSLDYSLISRYRSEGFWVEGYSVKNMNFSIEMKDKKKYSLGLRMYYNDDLALENIIFSGKIFFPWNIKLSSFLLYYVTEDKFQSVEVFLEKKFSNIFKLQCGYSLALKKFFVKFFTL